MSRDERRNILLLRISLCVIWRLRSLSGLPDGYSQIFRSYVFGFSGFWTIAPLRYAAKFDPFLSLDCAPTPSTLAQSKERKGSNFAIWQHCCLCRSVGSRSVSERDTCALSPESPYFMGPAKIPHRIGDLYGSDRDSPAAIHAT